MVNQQRQAHLKRQKKKKREPFRFLYVQTHPRIASPVLLALNFSQ